MGTHHVPRHGRRILLLLVVLHRWRYCPQFLAHQSFRCGSHQYLQGYPIGDKEKCLWRGLVSPFVKC